MLKKRRWLWFIPVVAVFCLATGCNRSTDEQTGGESDSKELTVKAVSPELPPQLPLDAATTEEPKLEAFLPGDESGWEQMSVRHFYPGTLYQFINGAAELYNSYGMVEMVTARFHRSGQPSGLKNEVEVDLYDMGSVAGAYGISLVQQVEESFDEPTYVGIAKCHDPNALCLWKGRYFARVITLDEDETAEARRMDFAKTIFPRLEGNADPPRWATSFPEKGLI